MSDHLDINAFIQEHATPPGDTLKEQLESHAMTQLELANRTGLDKKTINLIIGHNAPLTQETALALEKVFGLKARVWTNLETQYQERLLREAEHAGASVHADWARKFPYAQMATLGWVPKVSDAAKKAVNLIRFFGVSDPDCWKKVYVDKDLGLAFRRSPKTSNKAEVISAWLRKGELKSRDIVVPEYDASKFRDALDEIRTLTHEEPEVFIPKIEQLCAAAGVVYVFVSQLPSLGISGIMRWIGKRPIIQQCLRFKTNDQFWFTFFHEAAHVLQARKKLIFMEGQGLNSEEKKWEDDADRFAGELLIPEAKYQRFIGQHDKISKSAIRSFAIDIDLHPGVVAGRVMHDGLLSYSHPAGKLKATFDWCED